MLAVLAWFGVRWAARRLDRKRFAHKYVVAVRRGQCSVDYGRLFFYSTMFAVQLSVLAATVMGSPRGSFEALGLLGWNVWAALGRFLRLLLLL